MYILAGIPEALQLNGSIVAVMIIFLLYHFIMKFLFYSPIENILRKRAELTVKRFEKVNKLSAEYEKLLEKYESSLKDARLEGMKLVEEVRKRALKAKDEKLEKIMEEEKKKLESHKMEILESVEKGKKILEEESVKIAEEIVSKFLAGSTK